MEVMIGVIKVGMDHRIVMIIGASHREDGTMMMMMIGLTKVGANHQEDGEVIHMIHRGAMTGDLVKPTKEVEIGDGEALVRAERAVVDHRGAMTGVQASLERAVDLVGVQEKRARDPGVAIIGDLERLVKDGEVVEVVDGIVIIGMVEDGVVIR